ncbi:MAG: hypothetical protein WAV38_08940 [Xanthobacteraceae bacterium]
MRLAVHVGVGDRYYYRRYYNYYDGGGRYTWNGCRPGWTVQGGVYKPCRYGPWDWYR